MPNLSALSRGTQVLAAAGLLLLIDTFLPWQDFEGIVSWNAWHGFWGVVLGLAVIVLLVWVIARIMDVRLPVDVPDGLVTVGLGALIFLFALLKNLTDDYSTIWSYIGVLLAAAVAYGAWLRYQEAGGTMETLKASLPRQTEPSGAAGPAGTTPMQTDRDVTPTAAPASPMTTEPMTQAGPTPPAGAPTAPVAPAERSAPAAAPAPSESSTSTPPSAPTTPAQPSAPAAPTAPEPTVPGAPAEPTPRSTPADETEAERPSVQPPPRPTDER